MRDLKNAGCDNCLKGFYTDICIVRDGKEGLACNHCGIEVYWDKPEKGSSFHKIAKLNIRLYALQEALIEVRDNLSMSENNLNAMPEYRNWLSSNPNIDGDMIGDMISDIDFNLIDVDDYNKLLDAINNCL